MKTPSHIPALPRGYVYLGLGGSFKTGGKNFKGLSVWATPHAFATGCPWRDPLWLFGASLNMHYAAHEDSEVARLNPEELDDSMPAPSSRPRGWVQLKPDDVFQKNDLLMFSGGPRWAAGLIGEAVEDCPVAYRHPARFAAPAEAPTPAPAAPEWRDYSPSFTPAERVKFISYVVEAAERGEALEACGISGWEPEGVWVKRPDISSMNADHIAGSFRKDWLAYRVAPPAKPAAPEDGPVANLTDADPCPSTPPKGWVKVEDGNPIQENDWLAEDSLTGREPGEWAAGMVGESDHKFYVVYRHPNRFPKLVAWTFETAPKGVVLVRQNANHAQLILGWGTSDVSLSSSHPSYANEPSYEDLFDDYEHSLDGGKTWSRCGVST